MFFFWVVLMNETDIFTIFWYLSEGWLPGIFIILTIQWQLFDVPMAKFDEAAFGGDFLKVDTTFVFTFGLI